MHAEKHAEMTGAGSGAEWVTVVSCENLQGSPGPRAALRA